MSRNTRIALCHDWTTVYGGSEQVASRLADILNAESVFTIAAEPKLARQLFPRSNVHVHKMGLSRMARRHWPWLLPLMPRAWSRLELSAYDVVVTSAHACVNAVRVRPDAIHISYCHTPMRYAWDWRIELGRIPSPLRPLWPMVAAVLRRADRDWAGHVTAFIANSHHVAARIRACYGREATVVQPPVDTGFWSPDPRVGREGFFLFVGRLVSYKRADVAVRAARLAGVELTIAGGGPELQRLRRMADDQVRFIECPSREVLRDLYRRCSALLNPGVEDFGMTMAEAQACGTSVIALAAGGAREIVVDGRTGVLYEEASPEALSAILREFEPGAFECEEARSNAERFAPGRFDEGVLRVIEALRGHQGNGRQASDESSRDLDTVAPTPSHAWSGSPIGAIGGGLT